MVKRAVSIWIACLAALIACQGGSSDKPRPSSAPSPSPPSTPSSDAGFGEPPILDDAHAMLVDAPKVEEPEPADPGKLIAELGAIPAWQAVIDRAQLLARRGQYGAVYGTIGPPVMILGPTPERVGSAKPIDAGMVPSQYAWLVDDTEGNGTLGIRIELGTHTPKEGDRVALGGAWVLDDARRWYWKVDSVTPLPPSPPSDIKDPPPPFPSHTIVEGNFPQGVRMITFAKDNDAVYFQIVGPPPVRDGDGWLVANELGDVPFARMTLPGERASYGGQDMRAADERWQLKKAQN
jgi:hypothetical protein